MDGLSLTDYKEHCSTNEKTVKEMVDLAKAYNKAVEEEDKLTPEQLAIKNVGKTGSQETSGRAFGLTHEQQYCSAFGGSDLE